MFQLYILTDKLEKNYISASYKNLSRKLENQRIENKEQKKQ